MDGPDFDAPVPSGGYRWWYADALSEDGRQALVVIAFVGSVFSPYYARALRRGRADPEEHCALNIALYGEGGHHWAMTERGRRSLSRTASAFRLGRSALRWGSDGLVVDIDERMTPSNAPLVGQITLTPQRGGGPAVPLDRHGLHQWRPIAPDCHAEVRLSTPMRGWSGHGYIDTNWGERPIAQDFIGWDWSRSCGPEPRAYYEVWARDGERRAFGAAFDDQGVFGVTDGAAHSVAGSTFWRIPRRLPGSGSVIAGTLEDTPFYARSLARSRIDGAEQVLIHERLDCRRLASGWVQALLPFRMPREP